MCLALLIKPGGSVSKDQMEAAFDSNNDGAGFCFVNNEGNLCVYKGYMEFDKFWEAYCNARGRGEVAADSPIIIHFRIATAGKVCVANCHPFAFRDNSAALAHNGGFWSGSLADEKSDTHELVDRIQQYLTEEKLRDPQVLSAVNEVASGNKMIILYKTKNFVIINEERGHWGNGGLVWFSNYSYNYGGNWRNWNRRQKNPSTPATTVDPDDLHSGGLWGLGRN